jgi:hypothetical protein
MVDAPSAILTPADVALDVAAIVADPKSICMPTAVTLEVADMVA